MNDSATISANHSVGTQPFLWSVRRELWENRSIYLAPLLVAGVILFGFAVSMFHFPERRRAAQLLDPARQHAAIQMPYGIAAFMILLTGIIVGVFYCLDALHGERRDRSILFWKSLPVSDLTTVLSKVTIPLLVLPLVCFVLIFSSQLLMLLVSSAVLLAAGLSPSLTWSNFPFLQQSLIHLYTLVVLSLWHAPIYSWLLVVSGWARRATFLWAIMPFVALGIIEKVAFNTGYVWAFCKDRFIGFAPQAFDFLGLHSSSIDSLAQLTPGRFLGSTSLWLGFFLTAGLLGVAVRLRRSAGPI